MRFNRGRALTWMAPGILFVSLIAGCTDESNSRTPKTDAEIAAEWAAEIATAKAKATSEFEREVFADDEITQAEYDEAVNRYVECMNRTLPPNFTPFTASKNQFGMYSFSSPEIPNDQNDAWTAAHDAADTTCAVGTTQLIGPIFVGRIMNPRRQTPNEQFIDCLKRHGFVSDTYTEDNLLADMAAAEMEAPGADSRHATGIDLKESGPHACFVTPWA